MYKLHQLPTPDNEGYKPTHSRHSPKTTGNIILFDKINISFTYINYKTNQAKNCHENIHFLSFLSDRINP